MVDKKKLIEQLRKLKKQIQEDPDTRSIYDLDGDGNISGEEWEKARKAVIAFMEATEAREAAGKGSANIFFISLVLRPFKGDAPFVA